MKAAPSRTRRFTVQVFIGTRPEYIKLAPLLQELARHPEKLRAVSVHTRQHATLGTDTGRYFGVTPSISLPSPSESGSAPSLSTTHRNLLRHIDEAVCRTRPDLVVVQGDTLTAAAAAQCAFHHLVPVAHVEAGLRTRRLDQPWPEEILRVTISRLSRWHYAPTLSARMNLLAEGVDDSRILVTGNTVVDAFRTLLSGLDEAAAATNSAATYTASTSAAPSPPLDLSLPHALAASTFTPLRILLTLHRRENFGAPQLRIAEALRTFLTRHSDEVELLALSHPNPESSRHLHVLRDLPNVRIVEPLPYPTFIRLMRRCQLVASDSGGIQEEAPLLGLPVLVLREATERPELLESGMGEMPGSDPERILRSLENWLQDPSPRAPKNLFGDGHASERIAAHLLELACG